MVLLSVPEGDPGCLQMMMFSVLLGLGHLCTSVSCSAVWWAYGSVCGNKQAADAMPH